MGLLLGYLWWFYKGRLMVILVVYSTVGFEEG